MKPLLDVQNVTVTFGGLVAVNDVSFQVKSSEIVGIIGPNGSGKTTLFNAITGFVKLAHGEIFSQGKKISGFPPHLTAKRGIARSYQKTSLFLNLPVSQNIAAGRHIQYNVNLWESVLNTKHHKSEYKNNQNKIQELLDFLEMGDLKDQLAGNLSYGLQRRLGIGISLASQPKLLLLDEPAAGLNAEETSKLMDLIKQIREQQVTILLVEHDMKMVMGICDRVVVLNYGAKIAEGIPEEIAQNEEVIRVYLGDEVEYA